MPFTSRSRRLLTRQRNKTRQALAKQATERNLNWLGVQSRRTTDLSEGQPANNGAWLVFVSICFLQDAPLVKLVPLRLDIVRLKKQRLGVFGFCHRASIELAVYGVVDRNDSNIIRGNKGNFHSLNIHPYDIGPRLSEGEVHGVPSGEGQMSETANLSPLCEQKKKRAKVVRHFNKRLLDRT